MNELWKEEEETLCVSASGTFFEMFFSYYFVTLFSLNYYLFCNIDPALFCNGISPFSTSHLCPIFNVLPRSSLFLCLFNLFREVVSYF